MKIGWALVALIWVVPLGSLLACSHDLHGISACSSAVQTGRTLSFHLVAPGIWLGSIISDASSADPHAGASLPAYLFGILSWLALLSGIVIALSRRLSGRKPPTGRRPAEPTLSGSDR